MNIEILEKKDSKITRRTIASVKDAPEQCHLCWECANAYASKCPKIARGYTHPITNHEFITEGYQILVDGAVEECTVCECDKFILETRKGPITQQELDRARKAKENLRILYFGTETASEAYRLQADLIRRGSLKNARGRVLRK